MDNEIKQQKIKLYILLMNKENLSLEETDMVFILSRDSDIREYIQNTKL